MWGRMDFKTLLVVAGLSLPFFGMTIWAIVNVGLKDFGSIRSKVLWAIVAAIPFIGFIIYLLFGFRKGQRVDDRNDNDSPKP